MSKYFLLSFILCGLFNSCKQDISALNETKSALNYALVSAAPIEVSNTPILVRAIGRVSSDTEIKLSFKIGGIISNMTVDEGDYVRQGTLIANLRTNEIDAQVLKATRALAKAQRDLNRITQMYEDKVATLENVEDLRTLVDVSQADLDIAIFNQDYSKIVSPISGRVIRKLAEPNELVTPGQPLYMIASSSNGSYIMKASLSDKDINRVNVGNPVAMEFDAYPTQKFAGKIIQIAESADPRTGMFEIDINIRNGTSRMRNGFIGRIEITPAQSSSYLKVPIDAIVEVENNIVTLFSPIEADTVAQVWEIEAQHIGRDYILAAFDQKIQFTEVITSGATYIEDGDIIRIQR